MGRLTKTSLPKKTFTDSLCSERLSDSSNSFLPLQTLLSSDLSRLPPCLFCVSGIHRKRNYGFTRSTRPITAHERTAICKSQLEAVIKKPGNTRGFGTSFWSLIRRGCPKSRNAGNPECRNAGMPENKTRKS